MKEALNNEQYKLKVINNKCSEITTKILLNNQKELEYCNHRIGKRALQLKPINDDFYERIGES